MSEASAAAGAPPTISVVIPTCERGALALDTVRALLALPTAPLEILLVDQTRRHPPEVAHALAALEEEGRVRRVRLERRSIPAAMNLGARAARGDALLYLDDDVRIPGDLVAAHARALADPAVALVAGRIVQPWQQGCDAGPGPADDGGPDPDRVRLDATLPGPVRRFGGGNFCVRRAALFDLGGFDERFEAAAYRFEADLAERALARGMRLHFAPDAALQHLQAPDGGVRVHARHRRSASPAHSAGRYYYLLRHPRVPGALRRTLAELARAVLARDHLRSPWWIPVAAVAELRGAASALRAHLAGPRLGLAGDAAAAGTRRGRGRP